MNVLGMVLGGVAGFALGGPIAGLLGAAAGHFAENKIKNSILPEYEKKVAFTVVVIALSAKMAKADGSVSNAEIDAFRSRVDITPKDLSRIGKFWDLAKQTTDGFELYAKQAVNLFGRCDPILEHLLELLFKIAGSDGKISNPEWNYLKTVSSIFGYDEKQFQTLSELYSGKNPPPHLILGIKKDASISEIKSAWISLAQKHHPDYLFAKGMPQEFITAATERLASINIAYKLMIKKNYDFK